jgi:hypothetical protein
MNNRHFRKCKSTWFLEQYVDTHNWCGASVDITSQVRAIALFLLADIIMNSRRTTVRRPELSPGRTNLTCFEVWEDDRTDRRQRGELISTVFYLLSTDGRLINKYLCEVRFAQRSIADYGLLEHGTTLINCSFPVFRWSVKPSSSRVWRFSTPETMAIYNLVTA